MRTASNLFKAHLAGTLLYTALGIKIKQTADRGGNIFAFSDHDVDKVIDLDAVNDYSDGDGEQTYLSDFGQTPTALSQTADLSVDTMSAELCYSVSGISKEDLELGRMDSAEVKMFLFNWHDLSMGIIALTIGSLGRVTKKDHSFTAEFRGIEEKLNHITGDMYQKTCNCRLFSDRCGISPTDAAFGHSGLTYTSTGQVDSIITANKKFTCTINNAPAVDDWFGAGSAKFTSGININTPAKDIRSHTHDSGSIHTIELSVPTIGTIAVGDQVTFYAGCRQRKILDCKDKFNNIENNRSTDNMVSQSERNSYVQLEEI